MLDMGLDLLIVWSVFLEVQPRGKSGGVRSGDLAGHVMYGDLFRSILQGIVRLRNANHVGKVWWSPILLENCSIWELWHSIQLQHIQVCYYHYYSVYEAYYQYYYAYYYHYY
ncbi:hypothetical protein ANN_09536 [Periplaneta americana]|uniref:Uncharacterized protein n=1 Tax=Periplaneta americana TaxID=6978 RepID=A0ABQ8TPJ9_PERAM|nr:hypothetical protein ANN_09536 [Periplaneta americana]